jgi:hypothetical protein
MLSCPAGGLFERRRPPSDGDDGVTAGKHRLFGGTLEISLCRTTHL